MTAIGIGAALLVLVLVGVGATVPVRRRRSARVATAPPTREELAIVAENHRLHGSREHGQTPPATRGFDHGGWAP
ncbi:hypothetical protein [Aeromicrobium sp. Leaf350]|uniref:hypothetical protein n=1 Tax=Aeromicrobium sp. Leaf350 TaxID=2876565 RepID=UPI001E61C85B|nr:hypothetical protein [Aeromicrobium sp. Leaf350]